MKILGLGPDAIRRNERMRRTLPPTRDLVCFEAVARNRSVTKAAEELNLTQSAVSRRLASLEARLGEKLFIRARQRVMPTPAAENYAIEIRGLLNAIEVSTTKMLALRQRGGALTLACLPTFGSRWLVPRLNGFLEKYPEIDINLVTKIRQFSFEQERIHAAIYFGLAEWPNAEMRYLMPEYIVPVGAPSLLGDRPINSPDELRQFTLIQHTSWPQIWNEWFSRAGASFVQGDAGPKFEYFSLVIEAAVAGIGVALLPKFLIRREIENGLLAMVFDEPMRCEEAYHFVYPKRYERNPNVLCFADWLTEQCQTDGNR